MRELLHNSELFFEIALNSIKSGVVILDESSHIKFINRSAKKILNLSGNSNSLYLKDISSEAWEEIKQIFKTQKEQIGKRERILGKTLFVQRYPILFNEKVIGVISIFQHFSEMEKLANDLETYRMLVDELNTIIETVYDGIYVTDGYGKTIRVNSSWERITGLKAEDVLGKIVTDLEEKGYISKFVTPMVIEEKRPLSLQAKTVTGREVLVSGNPVLDKDNNVKMVVTTVRDLSEMRRLSRELIKVKELTKEYEDKIKELRKQIINLPTDVICKSKPMQNILETIIRLRNKRVPILIYGETGVGKGLLAKLIHKMSHPRLTAPFLSINCSAIPENLLEAELFGYEKGAFTGADLSGKPGLFELAEGGTLVLDEMGDLPLNLQAKLLSVLEDYEIKRLGGVKSRKINVRIICITNKDLKKMVSEHRFRQDLFFRINVVPIYVPPLRNRKEDLLPLVYYFLKKLNQKYNMNKVLSKEVIEILYDYHWPGNVRELKNLLERLMILSPNNLIEKQDLPKDIFSESDIPFPGSAFSHNYSLKQQVREFEIAIIKNAIKKMGNINKAAEKLKVSPSTLYRKLQN